MSLVTYPNSNKSQASDRASKKTRTAAATEAASVPPIANRLRKAAVKLGRFLVHAAEAIAEARVHRAMIEAELYRKRYMHTSKNDDDLPIVR